MDHYRLPRSKPPAMDMGFHQIRLFRTPSNLAWDTPKDGAATAALVDPCQGLTPLTVKTIILISSLN